MKRLAQLLTLLLSTSTSLSYAGNVEVLHWWTSGGEAKSIAPLKQMLQTQHHHWNDFAIEGGGGDSAMMVLATRAISGNPPSAAQIKGDAIREWASLGLLADLNDVAEEGRWHTLIPPVIDDVMSWEGETVAVPFNIHRVNWLWVNKKIFDQLNLPVPGSLDEFFVVADKLRAAGVLPLAHGGDPWQDATLFEDVALSVLGADLYRKAFVELDMEVLGGAKMEQVFTQFKRFHQYIDANSPGRDWYHTTAMVIEGRAAMQIMGDWAKGEFLDKGKKVGVDFDCVPVFGTDNLFSYNVDSFVFFQLENEQDIQAQKALAQTILTPEFQRAFNLNKGSIPVRKDVDISDFDRCALDSRRDFEYSSANNGLVPSMTQGMSTTSYVQGAIFDVVSSFFNDPNSDPKTAVRRLAQAVKAAM